MATGGLQKRQKGCGTGQGQVSIATSDQKKHDTPRKFLNRIRQPKLQSERADDFQRCWGGGRFPPHPPFPPHRAGRRLRDHPPAAAADGVPDLCGGAAAGGDGAPRRGGEGPGRRVPYQAAADVTAWRPTVAQTIALHRAAALCHLSSAACFFPPELLTLIETEPIGHRGAQPILFLLRFAIPPRHPCRSQPCLKSTH